jgi:hypothetical protein
VRRAPAPAHARDQGCVGNEPVHRAEDGRPQPATGDVTVLMTVCFGLPALFDAHDHRFRSMGEAFDWKLPVMEMPGWKTGHAGIAPRGLA